MKLSAPLVAKVLADEKTQARISMVEMPEARYQSGRSYALQARTGKAIGRIRMVRNPEESLLGLIEDDEVRAEGFATRAEFLTYWAVREREHGREPDLFARVWVLTFVRDVEFQPRLLGRSGGYTNRLDLALHAEPEAIEAVQQEVFTKEAHQEGHERHRERREYWERQEVQTRLGMLLTEAAASHIDISDRRRAIERQVELLRRDLDAARKSAA